MDEDQQVRSLLAEAARRPRLSSREDFWAAFAKRSAAEAEQRARKRERLRLIHHRIAGGIVALGTAAASIMIAVLPPSADLVPDSIIERYEIGDVDNWGATIYEDEEEAAQILWILTDDDSDADEEDAYDE